MTGMSKEETLALAETLLAWGVPVVVCRPDQHPGSQEMIPDRSWRDITSAAECDISGYRHGTDALALIGGHGVDVIDVDTKTDPPGSIEPFGDFECFGVTRTPSGGAHYVVASTGVRKITGLVVGGTPVGDYVGGDARGQGRLIAYLPGSHRPNKYNGIQYIMTTPWDVEGAVLAEPDKKVVTVLKAAASDRERTEGYVDHSPERAAADGLHPYAEKAIRAELARLQELNDEPWFPGAHWDDTTFAVACTLLRFANSGWTGYSREDARADLMEHAPRDDFWGARAHQAKWHSAEEAVGDGGRENPDVDARDEFAREVAREHVAREDFDVTQPSEASEAVRRVIGREGTPLAGLFMRNGELVYTPRVGEAGYVAPRESGARDSDVQVRRMSALGLASYMDSHYFVHKMVKRARVGVLFPKEIAARAAEAPELLDGLRRLRSTTHTPVVRADGSVLRSPGYDAATEMLFLPDRGLRVPDGDGGGVARVLEVVCDFPFVNEHHRANYLAALLTPLLRELVPPPYPLIAIGAPVAGAGKSLLAEVLRAVHGGVLRGEITRDKEELQKQITSVLLSTAAPVVTFDNVAGMLRSSALDSLLTTRWTSGRRLGESKELMLENDRLWTITGNNMSLGGDLRRRTVWSLIDPNLEHPEKRTNFEHEHLIEWVEEKRGEIIAALLSMVTGWVDAGRPLIPQERADSYGWWQQCLGSILAFNGIPGKINHAESVRETGLADEAEWGDFLAAVYARFGSEPWMVKQVTAAVEFGEIDAELLPDSVGDLLSRNPLGAAKKLGAWLGYRVDRWAGGLAVRAVAPSGKKGRSRKWRVESRHDDLL